MGRNRPVSPRARLRHPLALTLTVTVVLIGAVGYAVLSDQFQDRVLHRYAADQRAHVKSLQQPRLGTDGPDVRELHELINAIALRPGVLEVLIVDARHRIVSAHDDKLRGTADWDPRICEAKLRGGRTIVSYLEIRDATPITTPEKIGAVRDIIEADQMTMAFQPIWELHGNFLLGVEALARPHPDYGLSGPAEASTSRSRSAGCTSSMRSA